MVGQGPQDAPGLLRAGEPGLNSAVVIPGGRRVKGEPTSNWLGFLGCRRKLFSESVCSETTDQTQKFMFFAINCCLFFASLFARAAVKTGGRSLCETLSISACADVFKAQKEREFPRALWMS